MFLVSVGGIEVNGLLKLPKFFKMAFAMRKQALASDGCLSVDMFRFQRIFFVVSVWDSAPAMKTFAGSGAHGDILKNGSNVIKSASNMLYESDVMPTRDVVVAQWNADKG